MRKYGKINFFETNQEWFTIFNVSVNLSECTVQQIAFIFQQILHFSLQLLRTYMIFITQLPVASDLITVNELKLR